MTHENNLYSIQPLADLQLFWYDPATSLVFSDGFTAQVLPQYCTFTGPSIGEEQENTRKSAGKTSGSCNTGAGSNQANDHTVPPASEWPAIPLWIPLIPYTSTRRTQNVFSDRSIFLHLLKTKKMAKKITAAQVKNDAAFERTRENVEEFSRSGQAGKLLRLAFRESLINVSDKNVSARLVKVLFRVAASDTVNDRGERSINNGEVAQLENFNFNKRTALTNTLYARYTVAFDRATGQVTVNIPPFIPKIMVQASKSTTHFKITAAAVTIDFDKGTHEFAQSATTDLPWNNNSTEPISLNPGLPPNSTDHVLVVLSIELYQQVNAKMYALKSGDFNAAAIVKVFPKG